jgi:hypothetical protein
MKRSIFRAFVEIGFIVFLFYSNLLMGEVSASGLGRKNGLVWALRDIFTPDNFAIGLAASLVGYLIVEKLRDRSSD